MEPVSVRIDTLSPQGEGTALHEGRPVHVRGALPGEQVLVRLRPKRRGVIQAEPVCVEESSSDRVSPLCPHFGPCGGCALQHLRYPAQAAWKRERFLRQMEALGLSATVPVEVMTAEPPWGYRSKLEFTFSGGGAAGPPVLGFHERGSYRRVVDVQECRIAPEPVNRLLAAVREEVGPNGPPAYDPKTRRGFWRHLRVRANRRGELLVLLVTAPGDRAPIEEVARAVRTRVPEARGVLWGVSGKVADVATPERTELLWGVDALEERTGRLRFRVKAGTFLQPHPELAWRVYEAVRAAVGSGHEGIYDLYCGIGLMGLTLADRTGAVWGVESERESVDMAVANARLNGITNARFLCGRVEDLLQRQALFRAGPKPDVILLDPPRAGLHPKAVAPLAEVGAPRLLYLSCNPASLVRDLAALRALRPAYRLEKATLIDFFPQTARVEALAELRLPVG